MLLSKIAIILFIIGAIFGIILFATVFRNKPTNKGVVVLHGLFVAAGIVLVLIAFITSPFKPLLGISLLLFIIAALGGFTLLSFDLIKKSVPKWLAVIHPLVAIAGLICLIVYAFTNV